MRDPVHTPAHERCQLPTQALPGAPTGRPCSPLATALLLFKRNDPDARVAWDPCLYVSRELPDPAQPASTGLAAAGG